MRFRKCQAKSFGKGAVMIAVVSRGVRAFGGAFVWVLSLRNIGVATRATGENTKIR